MRLSLLSLVRFASSLGAGEPMRHESGERPARPGEGAFYDENDQTITPGSRRFDLAGQSLVFTPAGERGSRFRSSADRDAGLRLESSAPGRGMPAHGCKFSPRDCFVCAANGAPLVPVHSSLSEFKAAWSVG